jgi:FkbM family methyltransferase
MEPQRIPPQPSEKYNRAVHLFQEGDYDRAALLLAESLLEEQTCERWNDWATAKFLAGHPTDAEGGYRRALDVDPQNAQAVANLGALLAGQQRYAEAIPLLEFSFAYADQGQKDAIENLLSTCKAGMVRRVEDNRGEVATLWSTIARGLALQTVSLDRVLFRLTNLEADLRQHLSRMSLPALPISSLAEEPGHAPRSSDEGRFAVYLGENLALTRVLDRFKMYVDTRDISLAPHLLLDGYWELWNTKVFRDLLRPGMQVVDVGANIGYYTLLAAAGVGPRGRVHAVEADPHTFEILEKNVITNGFAATVHAHQCAAGDKRREVTLYQFRHNHGSNTLFADIADPQIAAGVNVPAVPLDELISEPVDVMKIDAEGSEPLIFDGMQELLRRSPQIRILMEFAPLFIQKTTDPLEFLCRIRGAGLRCQVVTHEGTVEAWPDERLLTPEIHTVFLSRN